MPSQATITATDSKTITIHLPDGLSVKPGQPVHVEVLEMIAAHARLQEGAAEAGQGTAPSWCIAGCTVQT